MASFSVGTSLDPSILVGPSQARIEQFQAAMNALSLHPIDPGEDDGKYVPEREDDSADSKKEDDAVVTVHKSGRGLGGKSVEKHEAKSCMKPKWHKWASTSDEEDEAYRRRVTEAKSPLGLIGAKCCGKECVKEMEKGPWPRLMMLGCGELETLAVER